MHSADATLKISFLRRLALVLSPLLPSLLALLPLNLLVVLQLQRLRPKRRRRRRRKNLRSLMMIWALTCSVKLYIPLNTWMDTLALLLLFWAGLYCFTILYIWCKCFGVVGCLLMRHCIPTTRAVIPDSLFKTGEGGLAIGFYLYKIGTCL